VDGSADIADIPLVLGLWLPFVDVYRTRCSVPGQAGSAWAGDSHYAAQIEEVSFERRGAVSLQCQLTVRPDAAGRDLDESITLTNRSRHGLSAAATS
jgi:hypothetical protein